MDGFLFSFWVNIDTTRYSATEFGGNKPTNFRLSGTLTRVLHVDVLAIENFGNWLDFRTFDGLYFRFLGVFYSVIATGGQFRIFLKQSIQTHK